MSGKAAKILLTEKQQTILQTISRSTTAPRRLIQRVSVILMAFNATIADEIGLRRKQVGLWRRRWQQSFDALVAIECRESQAALRRAIEDVLSDAPRSGSLGTFTAEQVTQILALACVSRRNYRDAPSIVVVFGIVGRRVVRRGNFTSLAALQERLLQFINYFNRTFAQPFRWTYTGRPTTAETVKRPDTWKRRGRRRPPTAESAPRTPTRRATGGPCRASA